MLNDDRVVNPRKQHTVYYKALQGKYNIPSTTLQLMDEGWSWIWN